MSKLVTDKQYKIERKDGSVTVMGEDEFIRWMCLVEGMSVISEKCDELELPKDDNSWVKPVAIQHYINYRYPSMAHDVKVEHMLGNL